MRRAGGDTVPFGLVVEEIRSIPIPSASRNLRVVSDPFDKIELPNEPEFTQLRADLAEMAERPGAQGHCGIEGLGDDVCTGKVDRKNLWAILRKISFRLPDEEAPA